jgi:hypothetical protein
MKTKESKTGNNRIELLLLQAAEKQKISKESLRNKIMKACAWSETRITRVLANSSQPSSAEKMVISQILQLESVDEIDSVPVK